MMRQNDRNKAAPSPPEKRSGLPSASPPPSPRVSAGATVDRRGFFVLCVLALFAVILVGRLFYLQILHGNEYRQKVVESVQTSGILAADRGKIYDRNMTVLANNTPVYRVFLSPEGIVEYVKEKNKDKPVTTREQQASFICRRLAELLGVDYDEIYAKALKDGRWDETVKKNVEEEEVEPVRAFIEENGLKSQVYLETTSKRFYPYDTMASNLLGFMGEDGGSYGLELQYDEVLQGTSGKYIIAKNANGVEIPFQYETYVKAKNGSNIVTTIDMNIQLALEKQVQAASADSLAEGGACGIVMDVGTGAILGMAQSNNFNSNTPRVLSETQLSALSGYVEGSEDYNAARTNLLFSAWNNKAVSWLYEPGSTFKVMTASVALEEEVCSVYDTFTCHGYVNIEGYPYPIYCHKTSGHGTLTFAGALQQSCNPSLIAINTKIGAARFWKYFQAFGFTGKTGVDLPGEAVGLYVDGSRMGNVELAAYSFGQTFKVTPLTQLTAIAAVANGGYLVTPHLVSSIVDENGKVEKTADAPVRRQVLSEETCRTMASILEEGVSGSGAAKNAYVIGYKVAAKTGTSQYRDILDEQGNSYLYIGSCAAYAPANNPKVAALILVDKPKGSNIYGSIVAAPYISDLLEEILPYLGVERSYSPEEENRMHVSVWDYTGFTVESAILNVRNQGLKYEVIGNGNKVLFQYPAGRSSVLVSTGKVYFYTDSSSVRKAGVPAVVGLNGIQTLNRLQNAGFNVKIEGAQNYESGSTRTTEQSVEPGTSLPLGSAVTVRFIHTDGTD